MRLNVARRERIAWFLLDWAEWVEEGGAGNACNDADALLAEQQVAEAKSLAAVLLQSKNKAVGPVRLTKYAVISATEQA